MDDLDDRTLLSQYAQQQSEQAFAALVARHVNLVYSVALRHTANPHDAEEITQAVFLLLAEKAGCLPPGTILSGWLYRAAQFTAANHLRMERRRQQREQEVYMQAPSGEIAPGIWEEISPLLDLGMARLGDRERDAIVLRFFEGKSLKEVGNALGATEQAVQKRIERALVKLRAFFARRGLDLTTANLSVIISGHSVRMAPPGLAAKIAIPIMAKGAALSGSVTVLVHSTAKAMAWLKIKAAAKVAALVAVAAGTVTVALSAADYLKLGRAHLAQGDYERAIADFDQAVSLDPDSAPAYFSRGRARKLDGQEEQALQDYNRAIQNDPKLVAAYVNRGQLYNRAGDSDRAIADFDQAIKLDPNRPIPYLDRGVAYGTKGDYQQAIADDQSALRIDPAFAPAYNNLALQLATCPEASIRDGKRAIEYATKACELSQWKKINQVETLAAAYAESGDFDAAIRWENRILGMPQLTPAEANVAQARRDLYQSHQPYHRHEPIFPASR